MAKYRIVEVTQGASVHYEIEMYFETYSNKYPFSAIPPYWGKYFTIDFNTSEAALQFLEDRFKIVTKKVVKEVEFDMNPPTKQ